MKPPLIGLVVMLANSCSAADAMGSTNCSSVLSDAGLNMEVLVEAVAHGIHSINIKGIRYFIDPSAPEVNNIPTVNLNLTDSDLLLPSAPLGFSDFGTPGMMAFDNVLANDDGTDTYSIQGSTRMEKIGHSLHMQELWQKAGEVYRELISNPPDDDICICVIEEDKNGIIDELVSIGTHFRHWGILTGLPERQAKREIVETGQGSERSAEARTLFTKTYKTMLLTDQASWTYWRAMIKEAMMNKDELNHFATYLYCKIRN